MSIKTDIADFVSKMTKEHEFSTNEFKSLLCKNYGRTKGSYIPSDYCYNRTNKDINYEKQPHYFLFLGRGKYKYVGENYNFIGEVESLPNRKK